MTNNLTKLVEMTQRFQMTEQEREQQRRSFAFGSAAIENSSITRDSVRQAAEDMAAGKTQVIDQRSEFHEKAINDR